MRRKETIVRRIFLAAAVLGTAIAAAPATAAPAVKVVTSIGLNAGAYDANNAGFNIMQCTHYDEETIAGSTTTYDYCSISVTGGMTGPNDSGNGVLALDFDPLLLTGTIKGTIAGTYGPIIVDLTYLASEVSTNTPYAAAEVVPTPPQSAYAAVSLARNGRINGTVSSTPTGPVPATNGGANVYRFTALYVTT
jgi:hypothetical protein